MIALFAVLVLSVAAAGTAYAAWTDTITFSGSVTTGTVDVNIDSVSPASGTNLVAYTAGDDTIAVTVGGATGIYPGWSQALTVVLKNVGTLPVSVGVPVFTHNDPAALDSYLTLDVTGIPTTLAPGATANVVITLGLSPSAPTSVEGQTETFSGSITFTQNP